MKIINKLTWRHLWANKKRTVITLFGIIISVAMVTAVFTSVESLMNTMGEITASYDGAWHAQYNELKSKDVQTLAKQKNVKAIGLSMDLGEISSKADSNSSKSRTDVLACNQNLFTIYSMKPATGRLPVTARELLVTKSFITRNDLKWKVGDTVTLPFTTYSADPQVEPETAQRTYTICGILENDNQLTGFYSAFCGLDDTVTDAMGTYIAQVQFAPLGSNTPTDIKAAAKALYGAEAVKANDGTRFSTHTDYLMYSGVQMNSEITRALYGFMAVILLIIVFASVFMIYDSFAVSYQQRARYLGMLASVGATRTQKRGSVYFEGFILGCIGIPIGILCGIGGILFLSTANFTGMLTNALDNEYDGMSFDVYECIFNTDGPLTASQVEQVNRKVSDVPGIESMRICADNQMMVDGLDKQLTAEAKKANMDRSVNVLGVDNDTFAALAKEAGIDPSVCQDDKIPTGILINRVQVATEKKQRLVLNPLQGSLAGQTLTGSMEGYDSEGNELYAKYTAKVAAQMNKEASNLLGSFMRPTLVVPMHSYLVHFPSVLAKGNTVSYARYYITAQDHDDVYNRVSDVLDEVQNGISHTGYDAAAQAQTMQALNVVVMTFGYGFITLITLISVMNIINTISSGMEERRREFAMIKSVGMTPKSFKKSIYLENIRYGVMALVWGLPVSLGLDYLMYKILGDSFDYGYTFRWYYYLAAALAVFAVIAIALLYAVDKIKKDNIIETLKRDDI